MNPGCRELTRTPEVAQCRAAFLVSVRTAPLAAAYAALLPSPPTVPRIEQRLTIEPPPEAAISGPRCFMPSHTPVESTDITASQCSTVSSSTVARLPMPALLTSPSSRPCSRWISSATSSHCASSATSSLAVRCRPGVPVSSSARVWHACSSRSVSTRWAPSSASRSAIARPSPPVAPVRNTTLSLIRSSTFVMSSSPASSRSCGRRSSPPGRAAPTRAPRTPSPD